MTTNGRNPVKPDIRLNFATNVAAHSRDLMTIELHIVLMTDEGIRNPSFLSYSSDPVDALADLRITAQANHDGKDAPYGWHVRYRDIYDVDLRRAESMVTTLRRIDRGMVRLTTRFGQPADFAAFCGYAADALGCTDGRPFGRITSRGRLGMYDTCEWQWGDVDTLRYWLQHDISTWREPVSA